ncbi:MAG TPA: LamG domain-containing protein [Bacteroidetes bacterium]|nr:LamG domain-containing protein [Bacteroidota bacterium]
MAWDTTNGELYLTDGEARQSNVVYDNSATISKAKLIPKFVVPTPVAWYQFENNGNDSSGNGNTATAYGDATYSTTKKLGNYSAAFDGTGDYFRVSDDASLKPTNLTICAWVRIGTIQSRMTIVSKDYESYEFMIDSSGKVLKFYKSNGAGGYEESWYLYTFETGKWYHLAITFNASTKEAKWYIDTTNVKTHTFSSSSITETTPQDLCIGCRNHNGSLSNYWNGYIDDVRIYNIALTQDMVTAIYNGGKGSVDKQPETNCDTVDFSMSANALPMPVAQYDFENNANDSTPRGLNGTATDVTYSDTTYKLGSYSAYFDGTDAYVEVPHSESLNFGTGDFSVSFWIKYDKEVQPVTYPVIISKLAAAYSTPSPGFHIIASKNTGGISFQVSDGTNAYNWATGAITGDCGDNTWHHIVYSFNRGTGNWAKIFVDGNHKTTSSNPFSTVTGSINNENVMRFAINSYNLAGDFLGYLDNIRIYNVALTTDQVSAIYNSDIGTATLQPAENWESVTPNNTHTFTNTGERLKWKAVASGDAVIKKLKIKVEES